MNLLDNIFNHRQKMMRFALDRPKCIEGIDFVASLYPGITQYYIGKIFYFADKEHFLDWGRPISGDRYIAMEHGPVPSTIFELLKPNSGEPDEVLDQLNARVDIRQDGNKRRVYSRGRDAYPNLSGTDREYLAAAATRYGKMSFGQLKALAHKEPAYVEAEETLGLNNEMNLLRWAEEITSDTRAIAAHVEDKRRLKSG